MSDLEDCIGMVSEAAISEDKDRSSFADSVENEFSLVCEQQVQLVLSKLSPVAKGQIKQGRKTYRDSQKRRISWSNKDCNEEGCVSCMTSLIILFSRFQLFYFRRLFTYRCCEVLRTLRKVEPHPSVKQCDSCDCRSMPTIPVSLMPGAASTACALAVWAVAPVVISLRPRCL